MNIKLKLKFGDMKEGLHRAVIHGNEVPIESLKTGDVADLPALEARLSRLTGLVVKIETGSE